MQFKLKTPFNYTHKFSSQRVRKSRVEQNRSQLFTCRLLWGASFHQSPALGSTPWLGQRYIEAVGESLVVKLTSLA